MVENKERTHNKRMNQPIRGVYPERYGDIVRMKIKLISLILMTVFFTSCSKQIINNNGLKVVKDGNNYTLTVKTKYCFGDEVEYSSKMNGSGKGVVYFIDQSEDGIVTYAVLLDNDVIQAGLEAPEIKLIKSKYP